MDLPFFKAFPTDWEVAMIAAGIPAARRGDLYRLIFFAWQQGGLNLTPDASYKARMRVLAQAFGIKPCHFESLLDLYRLLATENDGLWLPQFLLEQFVNVTRFQSKKRPASARVEDESRRVEDELKTTSVRVENELKTSSIRVEDELKTEIEPKSFVSDTPLAESSREIAKAEGDARLRARDPDEAYVATQNLSDAVHLILPGLVAGSKIERQLITLALQLEASPGEVLEFPNWLRERHPKIALTPFKVIDLLGQSLQERRAQPPPKPKGKRVYCGDSQCFSGWVIGKDPRNGGEIASPCPQCGGANARYAA